MTGTTTRNRGNGRSTGCKRRIGIACDAAGPRPVSVVCDTGYRGPEGFHGDLRGWGIEAASLKLGPLSRVRHSMKRRKDYEPLAPLFGALLSTHRAATCFNPHSKRQCCRSARITEAVVKTRSQQRRQHHVRSGDPFKTSEKTMQINTSSRSIRARRVHAPWCSTAGQRSVSSAEGIWPDLSAPGWVEHDPQEIWSTQAGVAAEAVTRAGLNGARSPLSALQSARDHHCLGSRDRSPIYNAMSGRTAAPPTSATVKRRGWRKGPPRRVALSIPTSPRPRSAGSSTTWKARVRRRSKDGSRFGTVDSWAGVNFTKHGLHITDVTNASRTMLFTSTAAVGRRTSRRARHSAQHAARSARLVEVYVRPRPRIRLEDSAGGHAGDQHAALFGQMCTKSGMVKKPTHRLFPRHEHGRQADRIAQQPGHHDCMADRRPGQLRAGRQHLYRRRRRAMAPRRTWHHQECE